MSERDRNNSLPARGPGGGPHRGGGPGGGPRMMLPGEKARDFKGTLFRLLGFMRPYALGLVLVVIFTTMASIFSALAPRVLGLVTNEISRAALTPGATIDFTVVMRLLILLASIYGAFSVCRYLELFVMAGVSQKTMYSLRKAVDVKLGKLPLGYYDDNTFGDILSRVTNDVDTVSNTLQNSITQIISSIVSIVSIFGMMLWISPTLTLIALLTIPPTAILAKFIVTKSQGFFRGQQSSLGALNGHVEEMYSGHNIIKVFGREKAATDRFEEINNELYNYGWKAQFVSSIIPPLTNFLGNLGYVLVALVGSFFAVAGKLLIGDIQSFIQYLRQFTQPISQTANIANILQSTMAAAERIFELLDEVEEPEERFSPVRLQNPKGEVTFDHVRFGYKPGQVVIKDLNLEVKPNNKVAIVGPTGAGKTTLVNLILRFYDVDAGFVKIDGVDIRDMSRYDLRSMIGMVLQDTWLFKGTIMENIRYGKLGATDEEVIAAAKQARANPFIKQLPGGYDFELKEDASNISQGQRQLITIARAILSDPIILILDEATSSVDTRTELLIQQGMTNLMKDRTSFVIAHRLSTIKDADTILVVNEGDIIESGNHNQLLKKGGFYANLYNSQFAQDNQASGGFGF